MNENCQKWHKQLKNLSKKHAEFLQTYTNAIKFAEENPDSRETSFTHCHILLNEIKPLVMNLEKDFGPVNKFQRIVTRLTLSPDAQENQKLRDKLLEMVSEENYKEAVATAKELDPEIKVPTHKKIIKNLLMLGREKLEKIATIMGKPALIIVPDKSMKKIIDSINTNPHYDNQNETTLNNNFNWSENQGKVSVSIVDMIQYPDVVPGQEPDIQRSDEQLKICENHYRENGMRLISDIQYTVAMQKSLRAHHQAKKTRQHNSKDHILDFYEHPHLYMTIFNQEDKSSINQIAHGFFHYVDKYICFRSRDPSIPNNKLRGRGAIQIM